MTDRSPLMRRMERRPASWVIRDRQTGEVLMETFDPRLVAALRSDRWAVVPILTYLEGLNAHHPVTEGAYGPA